MELKPFITKIEDWVFNFDESYRKLTDQFQVKSLKGFGCEQLKNGIVSAGAIIYHITESLNGSINHISKIQPISNNGIINKPIAITSIQDRHGKIIKEFNSESREIKDENLIYILRHMMKSVIDSGTGYENKKRTVQPAGITTSLDQIKIVNHDYKDGEVVNYTCFYNNCNK